MLLIKSNNPANFPKIVDRAHFAEASYPEYLQKQSNQMSRTQERSDRAKRIKKYRLLAEQKLPCEEQPHEC